MRKIPHAEEVAVTQANERLLVRCILFDQTDLFGQRIGGAETFLRGVVKHAPPDVELSVVGTTANTATRPLGRWIDTDFRGRALRYLPLVAEDDENRKSRIPLSLRYTAALRRTQLSVGGMALLFNRIEHSLAFGAGAALKLAVVHNDVVGQIMSGNRSETVWSRVPVLYQLTERHAVARLDHLFTVSHASLAYFRDRYADQGDKFSFLPTWPDPEIFTPGDIAKAELRARLLPELFSLQPAARWILFVGRLQEQKAPLRLVEVFSRYLALEPQAVLIIAGDGNLRDQVMAAIAAKGLAERVRHLSFVPQSELVDFYRASDALLLVSNYEGMPISVLEALACGLPVVSTRVGEVPRVICQGASGEVVAGSDAQTIAEALHRVTHGSGCTAKACIESVRSFSPNAVLAPVFDRMRAACAQTMGA